MPTKKKSTTTASPTPTPISFADVARLRASGANTFSIESIPDAVFHAKRLSGQSYRDLQKFWRDAKKGQDDDEAAGNLFIENLPTIAGILADTIVQDDASQFASLDEWMSLDPEILLEFVQGAMTAGSDKGNAKAGESASTAKNG